VSKSFILGLVAGLAIFLVVEASASRQHKTDAEQESARTEAELYKKEVIDATPVQRGVSTERQRSHSKLYTEYLTLRSNRTISDLVNEARGKTRFVGTDAAIGMGPAIIDPETPSDFFWKLSQESSVVIRGKVVKKDSQITEDEGFIFTDYDIKLTEVLKNSASTPLDIGSVITVTHPGGKVLLDGIVVKAIDEAYLPLPTNGMEVVLFLKFLPETTSYQLARDTGAFEIASSQLHPLTGVPYPPGVLQNTENFLQTVRAVSNR
jgi:uncharacterized membrane-anchored protein YhcB (DUF1043 family)